MTVLQTPELVAEAWRLPVASAYEQAGFLTQTTRSLCGPTSIVNALRSLGDDVERSGLLDGTGLVTIFGYRISGMTLEQLELVVEKRSPRKARILRDLTLDGLRAELGRANDPARRVIVNFHRGPVNGRGGGHHSPLGGYLADRDLAFVLDVNKRVKPWLVETPRLHEAIATIDASTGKTRGLLVVE